MSLAQRYLDSVVETYLSRQSSSVGWSLDSPCGPAAAASDEPPRSSTKLLHSEGEKAIISG